MRAYAKVNLFLQVMPLRPDGFHDIESVFHSIGLADELVFRESQRDIEVVVEGGSLPGPPEDNLVHRAAVALRARARGGVTISLRKSIPVGAGLGGGSADAAATLVALDRLWGLGLTTDELVVEAGRLGSDVPYCLTGGPMVVTGRGERLSPIDAAGTLWLVLGISDAGLSTADVYSRWDAVGTTARADASAMVDALRGGDVDGVAAALHNDLEAAAFDLRPGLAAGKEAMLHAGAVGALMSGSGPTIFGVCRDEAHARDVAARAADHFDRVAVVTTVPSSLEEMPGAFSL